MACAVVAWHTNLFSPPQIPPGAGSLRSLFCLYFLLLPVPCFFMISTFLFSLKVKENSGYALPRLERLLFLYLFWSFLWILIGPGNGILIIKAALNVSFWNALGFFTCWGIGAYYFFFCLLVITALVVASVRLPPWALWALLAASLVCLAGVGPGIPGREDLFFLGMDSLPANFLPFAFAGPLMARGYRTGWLDGNPARMRNVLLAALAAFIASAILEQWIFLGFHVPRMLNYTRPAPFFGAVFAFILAMSIRRKPGKAIRFLSDYSLAIYCTHPAIMMTYVVFAGREPRGELAYTLTVLAASIPASVILRRAFSRGLI